MSAARLIVLTWIDAAFATNGLLEHNKELPPGMLLQDNICLRWTRCESVSQNKDFEIWHPSCTKKEKKTLPWVRSRTRRASVELILLRLTWVTHITNRIGSTTTTTTNSVIWHPEGTLQHRRNMELMFLQDLDRSVLSKNHWPNIISDRGAHALGSLRA